VNEAEGNPRLHSADQLITWSTMRSVFSSERATFGQTGFSTGRLTQNSSTRSAKNDRLSVRENCGNVETTRTLDIHKVRVRALHQSFQLVLSSFLFGRGVEEIYRERHFGGL